MSAPYHGGAPAAHPPMGKEYQRTAVSHAVRLADGRVLHVRDWPGRGRPLVLLHGLLDSGAGWDELARVSPHRCLAVDLPGFGGSDPPSRPRLSAYAEDVAEALGRLAVRAPTLVGHSLGGGVATAVAERMGREVRGLVLSAPVGFGRLALAELAALPVLRALAVRSLPLLVTRAPVLDLVYAGFVTHGMAPSDALRHRLVADAAAVGPGLRAALEALAFAGRSERAFHRRPVRYDGPVAVLWGDRDAIVPPGHARRVVTALPQSQVHIWTGMGHHPQREEPARLAALV
ncbi:MAG TPA: alpha/beta fold hydrolase, partial [Solirubrobacteraceae bacterium]|nr:alpha/beta fold hydrolase [Solirubrobacteraceae bacterium]